MKNWHHFKCMLFTHKCILQNINYKGEIKMTTKQQPKTGWYQKQYTMNEVKTLHKELGGKFFDRETMRTWNSHIETVPNMANIFITSEKENEWYAKRRYTLRWFNDDTWEIETLGPFRGYDDIESARAGRKKWTEIKLIKALQQHLEFHKEGK